MLDRPIRRLRPLALVVLLGVVAIVAFRSVRTNASRPAPPPVELAVDAARTASLLSGAIRFETVSFQEPEKVDREAFAGLHRYLESSFPKVHSTLEREVTPEGSLLYRWPGKDSSREPVLLLAHQDVVPVPPETLARWAHPPFSGAIEGGFVWGRGAMDDKSSLVALLAATEGLLESGFVPERTVTFSFGHDEEVGGGRGAKLVAERFAERGLVFESVLDEGLLLTQGIIPGVTTPVALVGIAEKGYASFELSVRAPGGHSSVPPRETAIGILARALARLEANPLPASLEGPAGLFFESVRPLLPLTQRIAFSNRWLFEPLLLWQLGKKPNTNAVIRTTVAPTLLEGGVKENVLPQEVRAIVNCRIRPGDTVVSVAQALARTVGDPRVAIVLKGSSVSEPSSVSGIDSAAFQTLERTIREVFPTAHVAPSLTLGATDARHFLRVAKNGFRFLPYTLRPGEQERIHGLDERISVEELAGMVRFYTQFLKNTH